MKTIEEKAEEYAKRREFYLGCGYVSSVGLYEYIKQAYIQGAKDFLSLPLEERLTEEKMQSEPKPEPQFEVGELVMMRDYDDNEWFPKHFSREIPARTQKTKWEDMTGNYFFQCAKFDKDIVFTNKPAKK